MVIKRHKENMSSMRPDFSIILIMLKILDSTAFSPGETEVTNDRVRKRRRASKLVSPMNFVWNRLTFWR